MWRELISTLDGTAVFNEGASADRIAELTMQLGTEPPQSLTELLAETDGVQDQYGGCLIWSTADIERQNAEMRSNPLYRRQYMPLEHYLFFSDAGDGELFGFGILGKEVKSDSVYVWNPVNDGRAWVAPSLQQFLEWWISGKLQL